MLKLDDVDSITGLRVLDAQCSPLRYQRWEPFMKHDVFATGAGTPGLAIAGCLAQRAVPAQVIEGDSDPGLPPTWREAALPAGVLQ